MNNKELNTKYLTFRLEDGILLVIFKPGMEITLDIAKEMVKSRMKLTGDNSYPALVSDNGIAGLNKEAREYFTSEGIQRISACAFLADSSFSAFIGNFFIRANALAVPARLFTNKEKALKWLEQFKEK